MKQWVLTNVPLVKRPRNEFLAGCGSWDAGLFNRWSLFWFCFVVFCFCFLFSNTLKNV